MDIGNIECDESECHEGDTEYPCIEYDDEDDVGEGELIDCELVYDNYDSQYRGDSCDSESEYPYELEWEEGESHQIVHGETYELTIAVTRLSCETLTRIEYEGIPRVAHPVDETSVHTILLSESEIRLCHISGYEAIVGCAWLQLELRYQVEESVEPTRSELLDP